jgi:hypothetical protein
VSGGTILLRRGHVSHFHLLDHRTSRSTLWHRNAGLEKIRLVTEGKYSVWFKTAVGEGAGLVEFDRNG